METVAFCEIEPYAQKVLKKNWPNVPIYGDIREVSSERLRADGIATIDVITGGFPCQNMSRAGKREGIGGAQSGLWGELPRVVEDFKPRYAIFENVKDILSGGRGLWFDRVLGDLAEIGYDAEWHCIPAYYVGSPQRRDRVWIVAYPMQQGSPWRGAGWIGRWCSSQGEVGQNGWRRSTEKDVQFWPEPRVGRVANGIPNAAHRINKLGNAVVPQIPEIIGRAIMQIERTAWQNIL